MLESYAGWNSSTLNILNQNSAFLLLLHAKEPTLEGLYFKIYVNWKNSLNRVNSFESRLYCKQNKQLGISFQ